MRIACPTLFCLLLAGGCAAAAPEAPPCTPQAVVGTVCESELDRLHPTQFGVGQLQVAQEKKVLAKKSPANLRKTILDKKIAVVIGPDGRYWLADRHHLSRALWELGERRVPVQVVGRIDRPDEFWREMKAGNWAWLFDERGNPRDPADLPDHVKDLPDYGYRSLAGFAEDEHLFNKPGQVFFIEFAWARYFGEQFGWTEVTAQNLPQRLKQARRLACQPAAASLPGYPGAACAKR